MTIVKQNIVRTTCKINIKWIDIFFSNAFYVSKCFLNLINFDQLNNLCSMTYNRVEEVTERLAYDTPNFLITPHSNYHPITTHSIDEIKHIFPDWESTFEWFYISIFSHPPSCLDDDLTTSLHALYAGLKILWCKIIPFVFNDSFHLLNWMNSITTTTDTKFDEPPEIFNEIRFDDWAGHVRVLNRVTVWVQIW